jgi:hypothetical protein
MTAASFSVAKGALVTLDLQQGVVATYAKDPAFISRPPVSSRKRVAREYVSFTSRWDFGPAYRKLVLGTRF